MLAAPTVKETIPILDKLVAQMAALAKKIKDKPAKFIREREKIADNIEDVRGAQLSAEEKDRKLSVLFSRLWEIKDAEMQITKETIEQALKAAKLGIELRKLLTDYDKLTLDDISEGLAMAFKLAAGIPGLDPSSLKGKTDAMIAEINNDANLKQLFETAFAEIHKAPTK